MPLNPLDSSFRSFEKQVLPEVVRRGMAVMAIKPLAGGAIVGSRTVKPEEAMRYCFSLPVSSVVCGMENSRRAAKKSEARAQLQAVSRGRNGRAAPEGPRRRRRRAVRALQDDAGLRRTPRTHGARLHEVTTGSAGAKNSLIIATYNWKEALALVLATVRAQSVLPGEVLIADDGSRDDTRELVAREAATFPVPLRHFWQEDDGFRKSRILNEAMARATGEYLIEIDGDMLIHPEFVRSHLRAARPGWYIQGSRMMLGEAATARTLAAGRLAAGAFSRGRAQSHQRDSRAISLAVFARRAGPDSPHARLQHLVLARRHLRVNGYNEDMEGWGREDTELVARLMNSGVRRRNLKFAAVSYHLHHRDARERRRRCELRARAAGRSRRCHAVRARHRSSSHGRMNAAALVHRGSGRVDGDPRGAARGATSALCARSPARTRDGIMIGAEPIHASRHAARRGAAAARLQRFAAVDALHRRRTACARVDGARAAAAGTRPPPAGLGRSARGGVGKRGARRTRGAAR